MVRKVNRVWINIIILQHIFYCINYFPKLNDLELPIAPKLQIESVTSNSAILTWKSGSFNTHQYVILCRLKDTSVWTGFSLPSSSLRYNLESLEPGRNYEVCYCCIVIIFVFVVCHCKEPSHSLWHQNFHFFQCCNHTLLIKILQFVFCFFSVFFLFFYCKSKIVIEHIIHMGFTGILV